MRRRTQTIMAVGLALALVFGLTSPVAVAAPQQSLKELRDKQNEVRRQKNAQAGKVDALKADEAAVTAELTALNTQVTAQQDRLEEAERAVEVAETELAAARKAQEDKQAELDSLSEQLIDVAVAAFINAEDSMLSANIGTDDINETVHKRTLLSLQSTNSISLTDQIKSAQEDLAIEAQRAADAEAEAQEQRGVVQSRMNELTSAQAKQQAFVAQVESRLDAALAEADSLASLDSQLSKSITDKQAEIARNLAAQRRAEEERARQRAAAQRTTVPPSGGSSSGGGGSSARPPVVGSGEIVNVGGIQVHRSIASNVSSLLAAAAADGIHFGGGGYRSSAGQIQTRRNNCGSSNYAIYEMPASQCRPPTARPGASMHERGLAIDFTQGGRILNRSSSGFTWLKANAARFGLYNLPSEPWHWSTNGN